MTSFKSLGAALNLSTAFATPVFAQTAGLPDMLGDYAFFYPKDDFGPAVQAVEPAPARVVGLRVPARSHHHIRAH